jgi:hypothetical protein
MATYPVKNTETGETKEVVMSIHDWGISGRLTILNGLETSPIPALVLVLEKWESGKTNLSTAILVGMMYLLKHKKQVVTVNV